VFIQADNPRRSAACDVREIDLYDAWLFAEADTSLALGAWRAAGQAVKADSFAGYRAALDREEQAARALALRLRA
jgi:hypothetical protein